MREREGIPRNPFEGLDPESRIAKYFQERGKEVFHDLPQEPIEYVINCVEFMRKWIEQQEYIYGTQFYLYNEEVLQRLAEKRGRIVVFANDWMLYPKSRDTCSKRNNWETICKWYPRFTSQNPTTGEPCSGIYIYESTIENALMHQKMFFGSRRPSTTPSDCNGYFTIESLLIGSFNISYNAPRSIENLFYISDLANTISRYKEEGSSYAKLKSDLMADLDYLVELSTPWEMFYETHK